jgi:hypothetical protein
MLLMLVIIPVVIISFLVLPLFATVTVPVSGFIGFAVGIIRPLVILMFVFLPVFPALLVVRVADIGALVPSLYVGMVAILIVSLSVFMVAVLVAMLAVLIASLIVPLVLLCLWIAMFGILCDNWNCRVATQYQEKPEGSGCNLHASSNVTALLSCGVSVMVKSPATGGGLPVRWHSRSYPA